MKHSHPFTKLVVWRIALCTALLLVVDCAWGQESKPVAAKVFEPGKSYFGSSNYAEYLAGNLPVIIAAPHGGRERPENIPDRTKGTFAFDTNTQELAREIAAEFHRHTGRHAHVVICRLHRLKVDCNREEMEAAAGHPLAARAWKDFQGFIDSARATVTNQFGSGLFIDLHGHGHNEQRLELGYLHKRDTLALAEGELNQPVVAEESSLRALAKQSKLPYVELLRGGRSFGALLEAEGFRATPSPREPVPVAPYFNGGYNTARHARDGSPMWGWQLETNFKGVRDTEESRKRFAKALVKSVETFLHEQAGLKLGGN